MNVDFSRKALYRFIFTISLGYLGLIGCTPQKIMENQLPNVILIMADDMGYECLSSNGSTWYETPVLDRLGEKGMRFSQCIAQPLCTPSRVKIMTGLYNYRNYEYFTYLNDNQYTFGQLMQKAGYKTCIVGKWQLNGLTYELPGCRDSLRPHKMGFDEYCLWQLTHMRKEGERFANPLLEQNGQLLPRDRKAYGPDVVSDYALDFIKRHKDEPFFVYYPMLLVHDPFVPTPDSKAWADSSLHYQQDTAYFKEMVAYTDQIVGRFVDQLKQLGIADNTLILFTADNGTNRNITTHTNERVIRGAKGNTIDDGIHVPFIAYWPNQIKPGSIYDGLIGLHDFFPTLAEITNQAVDTDGRSFLSVLKGEHTQDRDGVFIHYDPKWGENVNQYRNQLVRSQKYKLYKDGRFYDVDTDPLEQNPIDTNLLSKEAAAHYRKLKRLLDKAPEWEEKEASGS